MTRIEHAIALLKKRAADPKTKLFGISEELAAVAVALEELNRRLTDQETRNNGNT